MMTLFNSLVRSKLEYCCQLWNPFKMKHIVAIEQIQRKFTRKNHCMADHDYWTRLELLEIMSLQRRREKSIIILVWKIKNNRAPNDINLEFKVKRNSETIAVVKPMAKSIGKIRTCYENSLIIKAAKIWNKIPFKLTETTNFIPFKTKLEKYLTYFPDKPPVKGFKSKNSLLDYKAVRYETVFQT